MCDSLFSSCFHEQCIISQKCSLFDNIHVHLTLIMTMWIIILVSSVIHYNNDFSCSLCLCYVTLLVHFYHRISFRHNILYITLRLYVWKNITQVNLYLKNINFAALVSLTHRLQLRNVFSWCITVHSLNLFCSTIKPPPLSMNPHPWKRWEEVLW